MRFDPSDPQGGPFPADRFTVSDTSQLTGLRVDLPKPDCSVRPSDCDDIDVLDTLDGFNLQPRLSIPFTGPIDPATVSSDTVFLLRLSCLIQTCPGDARVGISQVVWDPANNTLYAESDQLLDQDARYLLVVTNGIRDPNGERIDADQFHDVLHSGSAYTNELLTAVNSLKDVGVQPGKVAAASVFTTESATAVLEKIRDQLEAAMPLPADFQLGTNGERTVFPLAALQSIRFNRQDTMAPTFTTTSVYPLRTPGGLPDGLDVIPGAVGTVAFGEYSSPDYENDDGVIPAVGTKTGIPDAPTANQIHFNLFFPSGAEPPDGWPVVIAGHGGGGEKNTANTPIRVAAKFAQHGLATIAINAVGSGGGPLGTLTVTKTDATTVILPAGGRTIDRNEDGAFGGAGPFGETTGGARGSLGEGSYTRPGGAQAIVLARDGIRQTDVDLMQLVREIQVGIDVDGDSRSDLDPAHIYYFGNSFGGLYGTPFLALEPAVRAGVIGAAGGSIIDYGRLGIAVRGLIGQLLHTRNPSLDNCNGVASCDAVLANPYPFRENLPWRNLPTVINDVAGAIPIQEEIERIEWADQAGDPVAYAPHLRKAPARGRPGRPVLFSFAQGDPVGPYKTTSTLLRAGELADRTMYFRGLDAYAANSKTPSPQDLHEYLFRLNTDDPFRREIALAGQESVDTFLASDGLRTVNPDSDVGQWFETPIVGPLPGELP